MNLAPENVALSGWWTDFTKAIAAPFKRGAEVYATATGRTPPDSVYLPSQAPGGYDLVALNEAQTKTTMTVVGVGVAALAAVLLLKK